MVQFEHNVSYSGTLWVTSKNAYTLMDVILNEGKTSATKEIQHVANNRSKIFLNLFYVVLRW